MLPTVAAKPHPNPLVDPEAEEDDDLYDATEEELDLPKAYDDNAPSRSDGYRTITSTSVFIKSLENPTKKTTRALVAAAQNATYAMMEWQKEYDALEDQLREADPEFKKESRAGKAKQDDDNGNDPFEKFKESTAPRNGFFKEPDYKLRKAAQPRVARAKPEAKAVVLNDGTSALVPAGNLAIDMNDVPVGGGRGQRARKAPKRFGEEGDAPKARKKTGATPAPEDPPKKRKREVEEEPGAPTSVPPPPAKRQTRAKSEPKKPAPTQPPPPPPPSPPPPSPPPTLPPVAPAKLKKRKEPSAPTSPPPAKRQTRGKSETKKSPAPAPPPPPPVASANSKKRKAADEAPPPPLPPPPPRRSARSATPAAKAPPKPSTAAEGKAAKRVKLAQQFMAVLPASNLASSSSAPPPPPQSALPPPPPAPKKRGRPRKEAAAPPPPPVEEPKVPKKRGRPAKVHEPKPDAVVNDRGQLVDPVRSSAMSGVWAKRIAEGRSGRHGGAPKEKTVKRRAQTGKEKVNGARVEKKGKGKGKAKKVKEEEEEEEEIPVVEEDDGDIEGDGGPEDREGGSSDGEQDEGMAGGIAVEV